MYLTDLHPRMSIDKDAARNLIYSKTIFGVHLNFWGNLAVIDFEKSRSIVFYLKSELYYLYQGPGMKQAGGLLVSEGVFFTRSVLTLYEYEELMAYTVSSIYRLLSFLGRQVNSDSDSLLKLAKVAVLGVENIERAILTENEMLMISD